MAARPPRPQAGSWRYVVRRHGTGGEQPPEAGGGGGRGRSGRGAGNRGESRISRLHPSVVKPNPRMHTFCALKGRAPRRGLHR